ncbi:Inositolphosphorylceramide synthase subunit Kei1-domain-containing protein [Calycina marina]|uniref:Inositolphosphorylceramide synthase subunit Kei1-domain-containing protein n=1 Tax=Calycina marina TaxID=1763456 RepID=A0A9P7Z725_9HELO|nr:Inositolphosphorylceramide synthase subunit Kei1-domain-containing protein [Calycina marina]
MTILSRWLRLPRPRNFLCIMSLRTGTEIIALSMVFNKVTGFFGLLAVLAGLQLSPLQFAMYIHSLGTLLVLYFLMPHIRRQSPFECIALAYFYILDTVISTAFTAAFAVTWLLAVSADGVNSDIPAGAPGAGMIDDTAGFTNPTFNVSKVGVLATPAGTGQEAVAFAAVGGASATLNNPSLGHAVGIEETIPSMMVVIGLTLIRMYFIVVVMAYGRQVLRQHIYSSSSAKLHVHTDGANDTLSDNPFAVDAPGGQGWKGKLGRMMVLTGKNYWLGGQADDAWAKGLDTRFKSAKSAGGPPGTLERERRARSGTGPSKPPASVIPGKL